MANLIFEAAQKITRTATSSTSSTGSGCEVSKSIPRLTEVESQPEETDIAAKDTRTEEQEPDVVVSTTTVAKKRKANSRSSGNKENLPPRIGPKSVTGRSERKPVAVAPETSPTPAPPSPTPPVQVPPASTIAQASTSAQVPPPTPTPLTPAHAPRVPTPTPAPEPAPPGPAQAAKETPRRLKPMPKSVQERMLNSPKTSTCSQKVSTLSAQASSSAHSASEGSATSPSSTTKKTLESGKTAKTASVVPEASPTPKRTTALQEELAQALTLTAKDIQFQPGQQILNEFIKYCKNRKLNSEKCDITWIHIFLTSGRFKTSEHLLDGISLISRHHQKLVRCSSMLVQQLVIVSHAQLGCLEAIL